MKIFATSTRPFLCVSALTLYLGLPLGLPGSEKPRSITSLTANERTKLPDSTQVILKTGQTVSLGVLRAEHRARMERFARAAALGRSMAEKTKPHTASAIQKSPASSGKAGGAPQSANKPVIAYTGRERPQIPALPFRVPLKIPSYNHGPTPKDYVDFCTAANASACLYLPANTTLKIIAGSSGADWGDDFDYLITDKATCEFDGGVVRENPISSDIEGCDFYYPVEQITGFTPTGPLDNSAACDPPANYILDPKGAIKVAYPHLDSLTIRSTPATCVVQLWIEK
jgi:hypothetical protein